MRMARHSWWMGILASVVLLASLGHAEDSVRAKGQKAMKDGNWKVALEIFRPLALDAKAEAALVPSDLANAIQCLRQLGMSDEADDLLEKSAAAHAENWRLLHQAAQCYRQAEHYGYVVAGKFSRGYRRGQGQYVTTTQRDRARAIQLMEQARKQVRNEKDTAALHAFYLDYAQTLLFNGYHEAWRLQALTNLSELPDHEEGYHYSGGARGAPVNPDGTPVLHKLPATYEAARSDGERWRWLLMQAAEVSPQQADRHKFEFAQFLHTQFGAQTMAHYGFFGRGNDDKDESGPWAVKTLGEDETIARLATGIKRFKLPDEFNPIKIYREIANKNGGYAAAANNALGQIFEDRQQYPRAAECYKLSNNHDRLKQVTGNWGVFEPAGTLAAGQPVQLEYRFRNGRKASFKVQPVLLDKLTEDLKAYLRAKPGQLDWNILNLQGIGNRIVEKNEANYLGEPVSAWDADLTPRDQHFDRRTQIKLPVEKAGAYFVTATMTDGNTSRMLIWVADTVLLKKPSSGKNFFFAADAVTGAPVPGMAVDLFGYRQEWKGNNKHEIKLVERTGVTDADGQLLQEPLEQNESYTWLITARNKDGRFAFIGFTHMYHGQWYDHEYNQTKVFPITDRPAYRPGQAVKLKFWVNNAKYDAEGPSPYANQQFILRITNPKGEKSWERNVTADEFGGVDGEWTLPKDATLGVYSMHLLRPNDNHIGAGNFRVEEYKKPEFEVKIEAPTEPVMLGEKITATIQAKYYFGAPVTEGKVKFKVMRSTHAAQWYPAGRWDWYYAPGYWWFSCDYPWYPGWQEWGCKRPYPWWWGGRSEQPEMVMESEVEVGADGTVKLEIDTSVAKAMQGNSDHKYQITAEVTDQSRRTIAGQGSVMVARKPFKVYAWVDRGHYKTGDTVEASFSALTLDQKPVKGKGAAKLLRITYDQTGKPVETEVQKWDLDTNEEGRARLQLKADAAGQYRVSYMLADAKQHSIEGGYLFTVSGEKFNGAEFRFNDLELILDKREYQPGDKVSLMINTNRANGTVLLFVRPANGIYLAPKIIKLQGKSTVETFEVAKKDMPNFFIEAVTVSNGKIHSETREIVVPPESRVINVEVLPSAAEFKPGEKAKVKLKLTEANGEPFSGSTVVSIYDKAVEYISGGSNVPEIRSFFWKWRRSHYPRTESSFDRYSSHIHKQHEPWMQYLGAFGQQAAQEENDELADGAEGYLQEQKQGGAGGGLGRNRGEARKAMAAAPAMERRATDAAKEKSANALSEAEYGGDAGDAKDLPNAGSDPAQPAVRKNFADSAYWNAALNVGLDGLAEIELTMPENLTGWKIRTWAMGKGARVGQGEAEVVTKKNLLLRLQAPRFFTQKDEVVLSANVHNYLATKKKVTVVLELDGGSLAPFDANIALTQEVEIEPKGEKRVDWLVKVLKPGEAVVRMKALTNEESDAMEVRFPAYVHGMLKTESFAGSIRAGKDSASVAFNIPAERLPEQSRMEVRYSPTLAGAMVDALPYLCEYPYGCTEQTLSRFLPATVTQNVLQRMGLKLKDIRDKLTNLNAQEIGNDRERAAQWKRYASNPVFDEAKVNDMVKSGIDRLANMQCGDGGWGWFSGYGEQSYPHTTAYVVHGLHIARENDVQIPPNMIDRGLAWLRNYQSKQIELIKRAPNKVHPYKESADNLDAFVFLTLAEAKQDNKEMREFLYRDRNNLSVYTKAIFGLALHKLGQLEQRDMLVQNVEQFLVQDEENQTAYLKLPENNHWWYWYGSEYEAHAYYLKLLSAVDPKGEKAARLVKYLINNRKHATYWNSTRDTALCIEAMADFLKGSGEDKPDYTLEVIVDGKKAKEVAINPSNLFTFDNAFVLTGDQLAAGKHTVEFVRKGKGPLYFNTYVTNFTLEDHIAKAGLEIKVERKFYRLKRTDKTVQKEGAEGQVLNQKAEKYERELLANLAELKSGELVEVELEIESKNDYEYILFEDLKAAGFEPVDVRSGYTNNGMGAYMELRDERVCFFVRWLARGKHSVSYRIRAEIPGKFSALPTRASAMYAPELKANSDELKLKIKD